ncbi:hypothetical protein A2962_04600 [Candidatus Woesebacteria bacterium RIFCSPLOWO2_01_FULL_39_61]|uniref:Uncharacterized protein n=1 Tax=Candidatus Woesebacteria bacterium RIFCSPHIGHO2_02_FULL_39_13 TaxID=1802505 RepID=A0A1F7Z379_9BACT|nr:MAG: hypothetical protein A2692_03415 [Candidatus Woesebacteria bacterium RIFCSPHIGHO2_01_FULL_39_95]OGM33884.1 MAG: hypothetical protein A3D01_01705 [Candidatus Woesebacteria bacterium RIFCSPHIGHO2_02_FULL_39_13]OGM38891.1 MAG: hypothetical protein A3E13_04000 [Candidatus Woesebacteria bacterium RIFCSPHIGHO2_12_FULL_40_20]OGM67830.1 MAG: hypothetical protein A2962_04600 [Candidatus Woesebacteria bacterium RIFCSPLOWO2_01_FULL_39_61]OGM75382.1 MAG: hypothetical protein A3H19_01620 [Candidatus
MNFKRRLVINIAVLLAAIVADGVAIWLIWVGVARNENEQVLLAFALISSLVLTIGSILALLLSIWIWRGRRYFWPNDKSKIE